LGSVLKALGLTLWGLIGLGLAAVFVFVGYQAALKHRAANAPREAAPAAARPLDAQLPVLAQSGAETTAAPAPRAAAQKDGETPAAAPASPEITRSLFQNAAALHHHYLAIEYGRQLMDDAMASAEDMVAIAQSYASIEDCSNARATMERAIAALRAAGREPSEAQRQVTLNCHDKPRVVIDPAHWERTNRLLQALTARAAADRDNMPRLEQEAAASPSGNSSVLLGELYYGFGEYAKAIAAIRRGLNKGGVLHLDDAYVYLGLAAQRAGDLDEARQAFAHLKDVPGISPRVLKLWTLYAEVQLQ
jgi:tetratricopeptide (TPR) repeat protein